ncbi:glycosyl hydrolase family 18 protein [Planctomycetota bacterium]
MKYKVSLILMLLVLMFVSSCTETEKRTNTIKGRRIVSPWFLYSNEANAKKELEPMIDIISSLSVFGEPTPAFVEYCHANDIETYFGVFGGASVFDTPARRKATIEGYLKKCEELGLGGIDLDLEHLDPSLQLEYSKFLKEASEALHKAGKKLAICVGFYPAMYKRGALDFFYDPVVIGKTCDMVRVMCYDMYYANGKGDKDLMDRADCQGIGPTSTAPWARNAMLFWLKSVPRKKLIMGLPAYSNDYDMIPDGRGAQITEPMPKISADKVVEKIWLPYEKIHVYRYLDDKDRPHMFFASDAKSTKAHLETVDELNLPGIAFWYYQAVTDDTWQVVRRWVKDR